MTDETKYPCGLLQDEDEEWRPPTWDELREGGVRMVADYPAMKLGVYAGGYSMIVIKSEEDGVVHHLALSIDDVSELMRGLSDALIEAVRHEAGLDSQMKADQAKATAAQS